MERIGQILPTLNIRWHGRGGFGAKTAALLLAEAVIEAGGHAQASPEFGPERRGAPVQAYTRIAPQPIRRRGPVEEPDVVVVLDRRLLRVPVVRGRQVVGIVSRNDVLKAFLVDDAELARRVEETLRELDVPPDRVRVEVRDGVVHLKGRLASPAETRLVALCVRGLDGVVAVDATELEPAPEAGP